MEIGIWSNEMAENIPQDNIFGENWDSLPANINMCSRNNSKKLISFLVCMKYLKKLLF